MARSRLRDEDDGFSLIELSVVLIILGILSAIAIPTFIGMRERFQDTAAKESAVLAVRTALGLGGDDLFEGVTTAAMNDAEPSLTFVDDTDPSTSFTVVSQLVPDAGAGDSIFVAAVRSSSGTCFMIRHQDAGSDFAKAVVPSCEGADHVLMVFGPSW